jgi:biopolymer transport protein ExbB
MIWMLAMALAEEPTPQEAIQMAFEREFAYVHSEKRALEEQLIGLEQKKKERLKNEEAEILSLEKEYTSQKKYHEALKEQFVELEKQFSTQEDVQRSFFHMLSQAEQNLGQKSEKTNPIERFESLLDAQRAVIKDGRTAQQRSGEIYREDGSKVTGSILQLGGIAAFGQIDGEYASLIPLGDEKLQFVPEIGQEMSKALFAGDLSVEGELFLLEGFSREVTIPKEKTALEVMEAGGFVAWVIAGLGCFGLLIGLIRAFILILSPIRGLREEEELHLLVKGKESRIPLLSKLWMSEVQSHEQLLEEAESGLLKVEAKTNRFSAVIPVIAAVAPLLGLLGTVTGMIATFEIITEHGTGDPRLLSSGISEALITTQLGLMVAIPMLLLGNVLKGWAKSQLIGFEGLVLRVVATRKEHS